MKVVGGSLDLLLGLERQLIHRAGGVLQHTVNLERAAHDNGVGSFLFPLRLAGGVLAVDCAHRGGAGGLQLDISICQRGTTGAGGNRVIKSESVQQQRTAPEHINDLLVNLVGHTDFRFR